MKVERYTPQKRKNLPLIAFGCITLVLGCVSTFAIMGILLFPMLSGVFLQGAGFEDLGASDDIFAASNAPAPQLNDAQYVQNDLLVVVQGYGQRNISTNNGAYNVQTGEQNGVEALQISSDETGLLLLCQQYSDICSTTGGQAQNVRFDLRPNGLIVYGDFYIPQINSYQNAGIVMQTQGTRLVVVGIELSGRVYGNPPEQFASAIDNIENQANALLGQLLVTSGGENYALQDIFIDDTSIILTMR